MPASATSVYMILATIDPWPPHIHATISNLNRPMLPQLSAPIITKISDILSILINNGYCDALFAGNALATHDLEGDLFHTGLGQDIYTKHNVPNGHYHHLHTINLVRKAGGIKNYVEQNNVRTGIMQALVRNNIPYVLAGSIRDDGPLPDVIPNVYDAQDAMRKHTSEATTVIALATQLHTIATGNMTPSYQVVDGVVRPVYFYVVDVSEFAVNKLKDRGSLSITGVVTNIQDFIVNAERNLIGRDGK